MVFLCPPYMYDAVSGEERNRRQILTAFCCLAEIKEFDGGRRGKARSAYIVGYIGKNVVVPIVFGQFRTSNR